MEKNIILSLATYAPLEEEGEAVVWFIEHSLELILEELEDSFDRMIIYSQPLVGFRNRRFLFNADNWSRIRKEVLNGELKLLRLTAEFDRGADPVPHIAEITVNLWSRLRPDEPGIASTLELGVNRILYGSRSAAEWQMRWIELGNEVLVRLSGVTGFITLDHFSAGTLPSPYEVRLRLPWAKIGRGFRSKLRGYYWGNWLSEGHIVQLGGIAKIQQQAPCYQVKEVAGSKGSLAYLQLTTSLDNLQDNELLSLRDYLYDLLPVGKRLPHDDEPPQHHTS